GLLPLSLEAIEQAIRLNGAAVDNNLRAFELGRWAVLHPQDAAAVITPNVVELPKSLEDRIAFRVAHLTDYQGTRLVRRYTKLLDRIEDRGVKEAAALGYHKLLSYKDEYEVARLLLKSREKAKAEFEGDFGMKFHLAPPMLTGKGPDGRPKKREFGSWLERPLRMLTKLKRLRGTPFDPFGYSAERKMERALIKQYEADMAEVQPKLDAGTRDAVIALAELPLQIRGFGPVKEANEAKAAKRREELLAVIRAGGAPMAKAAE
ncbi:MAG: indolepyruvate ferredoxin oxidoreductase family protein, partial [Sulfitobacter sp.]|nr:indolepyruvate ferredoxin oxidoreductase family protein [Sulfitobacter sp.]